MNSIIKKRIAKIRQALVEKELDALMVSVYENRYYLSGFTGEDTQFDESAGILIISDHHLVLATDSRYELQARAEADGFEVVCYQKGLEKELPGIAGELEIQRLGFESVRLSHKNHAAFADALEAHRDAVVAAGGGTVGELVTAEITSAGKITFVYVTDPEGNIIELQKWG